MRKFNSLAKLLFPAFLIFPYVAQAGLLTTQTNPISQGARIRLLPNLTNVHSPDNCQPYESVKVTAKLTLDTQGNVAQVTIVNSSGSTYTDKDLILRLWHIKFYPAQSNGIPVVSNVIFPISITCPPPPPPPSQAERKQDEQLQEILRKLGISNRKENF